MLCKIEGCNHTISRQMRIGIESNCWGLYQICPCCAIELGLIDFTATPRCNRLIQQELVVTKKEPKKVERKPIRKIWIEYDTDATDRSVLY